MLWIYTSTLGILKFEVPELEEDRSSATLALLRWTGRTYDPSSGLAVVKLLSVTPLLHELVRGIKANSEGPFTEEQGSVPERLVNLNPIEI